MSRPGDWYPLAGSDPVPGDPEQVRAAANHYGDIASRIRDAASSLLAVSTSAEGSSEAVAAFRDKASDVRTGILKAQTRYEGLADALGAYAPHLASAQDASLRALELAREAQSEAWSARTNENYLHDQVSQATDPVEVAEVNRRLGAQQQRADAADADLARARRQLEAAIDERDRAAETAIQQISDVEAVSPVRDQWHDKMRDWAGKVADAVAMWVEVLGEVLDRFSWVLVVVQIALMVAAFLIPGAAAVILLVKIVTAVVKALTLISKIVAAVKVATSLIQLMTGRKKLDVAVGAIAGVAAGAALGVLFDKFGTRAFNGAAAKLQLSEKMRFVRQGMKKPDLAAERWASEALADQSHMALLDLYERSTDYGRRAIAAGVTEMLVIDQVAGKVTPFVSNAVRAGVDFVLENPPLLTNDAPRTEPTRQAVPTPVVTY